MLPGLRVQHLADEDLPTWKDLTIAVDAERFGLTRDELVDALRAEGIDTRRYFDPPVHRQRSHAASAPDPLPVTDTVASSVVSLPLYRELSPIDVDRIVSVVAELQAAGSSVAADRVG